MTTSKETYHHGDLRQSLILTATDILKEHGVDGISMRKLADQVGVSRTAPYHHFKDKTALLCSIAEQGFILQNEIIEAFYQNERNLSLQSSFEQYVFAYIQFAEDNSETYDLMYGRDIWKSDSVSESLKETSKKSFKLWIQWIEILQKENVISQIGSPLIVGQTTWATLHGICRLFMDGIYLDRQDIKEMAQQAITLLTLTSNNTQPS
ncbi:TetR/AcrR family transcriptional regulator [Marinomonas sp. 2405UD68-3]|uniref:TetR/AcrR family transcriptional regulator n=1 Tax=Marinomonas sp. 2405UD68-3 TaxID=3391835 RepID=UPI0039C8F7FA